MLALLLSFVCGIQVVDSGSTVRIDTVSAILTMTELRQATIKLEDYVLLGEEVTQHEQRHTADSTALTSLEQAYKFRVAANDLMLKALTTSDSARKACVVEATKMDKDAQRRFRIWVGVTGAAGVLLSVLTFFAGMGLGS